MLGGGRAGAPPPRTCRDAPRRAAPLHPDTGRETHHKETSAGEGSRRLSRPGKSQQDAAPRRRSPFPAGSATALTAACRAPRRRPAPPGLAANRQRGARPACEQRRDPGGRPRRGCGWRRGGRAGGFPLRSAAAGGSPAPAGQGPSRGWRRCLSPAGAESGSGAVGRARVTFKPGGAGWAGLGGELRGAGCAEGGGGSSTQPHGSGGREAKWSGAAARSPGGAGRGSGSPRRAEGTPATGIGGRAAAPGLPAGPRRSNLLPASPAARHRGRPVLGGKAGSSAEAEPPRFAGGAVTTFCPRRSGGPRGLSRRAVWFPGRIGQGVSLLAAGGKLITNTHTEWHLGNC